MSKLKSSDESFIFPRRDYNMNLDTGVIANDQRTNYNSGTCGLYRLIGDSIPGWKLRIARGENATTLLQANRTRFRFVPGRAALRVATGFENKTRILYLTEGMLTSLPVVVANPNAATLTSQANNEALKDFIDKARSKQRKFSSLLAAGELGDTLRMLRHPAKTFRKRLDQYVSDARRNFRRSKGRSPKVRQRAIRDTWLEFSFGVKPLMSDISDAKDAIGHMNDEFISEMVTGRGRSQGIVKDIDYAGNAFSFVNSFFRWSSRNRQINDHSVRYFGRVNVPVDPNGKRLATRTFGLSFDEFLPTVWELIPHSFLVDYFTNIGDIISALSYCRSNVKWVAKTSRISAKSELYGVYLTPYDYGSSIPLGLEWSPHAFSREELSVDRQTFVGSLVPQFEFQLPGLSSTKWLNIAALVNLRRI